MNKEKRKYVRLDASIRVEIIPYEVTDEKLLIDLERQVNTLNIGAGGILIKSGGALFKNTLVQLFLYLPSESQPIEALGEIRHLARLKNSSDFDVGICFLKISPEDKRKLFNLRKL